MGLVATKPDYVACEQQKCRPACASAQTDQRLCCSLSGKYNGKACYMQNINIPASLVAQQVGFSLTLSQTPNTCFLATRHLSIGIALANSMESDL